jgi:pimeloyl-ACP methyl ester carboxylesterase
VSAPRAGVLIIPGLNGHPGMLMDSAPRLFPGWRAIAFNHHGDQAVDGVEGLARRALETLRREEESLYLCGESFGGTIALTLARIAPERVRGLILFSTFGWHPSTLARRGVGALALWSFLGRRVYTGVYRAGRMVSLPTQLGVSVSSTLLRQYLSRPRADVQAYRRKAELSLTFDARPWLGSIAAPAFVLTGTWDPVVPASAGRELARRLPNATLHVLPGGHLVHLVHADAVGHRVDEWARSLHL